MQTTDTSNLFQSDAAYDKEEARARKRVRAARVGSPIELPSKVLRMVVRGQEAWTAESGWVARRVDLHVGSEGARGTRRGIERRENRAGRTANAPDSVGRQARPGACIVGTAGHVHA